MYIHFLAEINTKISIDSVIDHGSWVRCGTEIDASRIGKSCFVGFRSEIRYADIGNGSMIAARTKILGCPSGRVVVGRNAWIGTNATIASSVRIGDGAVIAAGAYVIEDVPHDAIVVGRPARTVFSRIVDEDSFPDPSAILSKVRQRAMDGLPSFLDAGTVSPDRAKRDNSVNSWNIADDTMIDAELCGGEDIRIGRHGIFIGRSTKTGGIAPGGGLHLGDGVRIADRVIVEGAGGLQIEEGSLIGESVTIVTSTHNHRFRSLPWVAAPVQIGRKCVVGAGAVLIGPVKIGDGALIEPNSVVVRDVPPSGRSKGVITIEG